MTAGKKGLNYLSNPLIRFLLTAFSLYLLWYVLYDLWLHPAGWLDTVVIQNSVDISSFFLKGMGFTVESDARSITLKSTSGLWIADSCNAIQLCALFAGFIIAYPGPVKKKIWFIPLGALSIHFLNICRIAALSLIQLYNPHLLDFNHTYTFAILMYGYIFLLWMIWVKLSAKTHSSE